MTDIWGYFQIINGFVDNLMQISSQVV